MSFKRQSKQLSVAKAVFIEYFKKKKQKTSFVHKLLLQPSVYNNNPSINDTSLANISDKKKQQPGSEIKVLIK